MYLTAPVKSGTAFSAETTASDQIAVLTRTEILTILSPIREAEGPEIVRKWSL